MGNASKKVAPTWHETLSAYFAAVETGSDDRSAAARNELLRVAQFLDGLHIPTPERGEVYEVITDAPGKPAYGVTFSSMAAEDAYCDRMRAAGYTPATCAISLHDNAADALAEVASYYGDPTIVVEY